MSDTLHSSGPDRTHSEVNLFQKQQGHQQVSNEGPCHTSKITGSYLPLLRQQPQ